MATPLTLAGTGARTCRWRTPRHQQLCRRAEYAHGGISLQECLVPVLELDRAGTSVPAATVAIQSVIWKVALYRGGRRMLPGQRVDIRTKAASLQLAGGQRQAARRRQGQSGRGG